VNVFLSYAVRPWDAPIAARLRAVAAAYDIAILLPVRNQVVQNGLTTDTLTKIKQSDAVIALITNTAPQDLVNAVNLELPAAAQAGKPIIALIEDGVPFQSGTPANVVYFNRLNPTAHESSLMNALQQIRSQQQWKKDLTALGWIAGIALGLVALSEVLGNEK
jgi:nucleoside 2-deoxyribosyltransferase